MPGDDLGSGFEAMTAIRHALRTASAEAADKTGLGQRGHIYFANWRFNCLRDLSETNPSKLDPLPGPTDAGGGTAAPAIGLVLQLLAAGI